MGDSKYSYKNELDRACFQHDMADEDFKDLPRRTIADKILCDKTFNIAKTPKYDECQHGLVSMGYKFFQNFQKVLDESGCKPNKIWVDKGSEFHNKSLKSWL